MEKLHINNILIKTLLFIIYLSNQSLSLVLYLFTFTVSTRDFIRFITFMNKRRLPLGKTQDSFLNFTLRYERRVLSNPDSEAYRDSRLPKLLRAGIRLTIFTLLRL